MNNEIPIYLEEIPEHYLSPDVAVTIHYKKLLGAGLADLIANLIRSKKEPSNQCRPAFDNY